MLKPNSGPNKKTIWIDLDNSPHVPFFIPIIEKCKGMGCAVQITARDCFQVCGLADRNRLKYDRVGKHYGKSISLKALGTLFRAVQLFPYAAKVKPTVAISHGSRAMNITARILNITTVEMTDYEFARNIPFIHPALIIAPEILSIEKIVNKKTRVAKYPGIKEDVYVPFFKPDRSIRNELGLSEEKIIVTIRPPATEAHYHNPDSEILFAEVMNMLGSLDKIKMVILPRNEIMQTAWIKEKWPHLLADGKVVISDNVVDGLNLIWHSDLVISGGGTMNREAAALGVPVYSIFRGKTGAVDRYLSEQKRLTLVSSKDDVRNLILVRKRKAPAEKTETDSPALNSIVHSICGIIENASI